MEFKQQQLQRNPEIVSLEKKVEFLEDIIEELKLENKYLSLRPQRQKAVIRTKNFGSNIDGWEDC